MKQMPHFTRIGFILAAAGSAVGLGNIWKFPYITGMYGGGAFVMVYLITVAFIGFSVLLVEMYIGSKGHGDAVTSFEQLAPKHKTQWKYAGFMAFNGLLIMTFYSVVIGWIFYNMYTTLVDGLPSDVPTAHANFAELTTQMPFAQILWHALATLIVLFVLYRGVKSGIEKMNMILMPALIIILLGMLFYAISFGDAFTKSLTFMFYPDWSKLSSEAIVKAIGHAFFTLSIGMGAILTYAASLPKNASIAKAAFFVTLLDTLIALIAGILIFAFLFQFGEEPAKGPGLVFESLPVVFSHLGFGGAILAELFFLALAFAGLTSSVSLVEPTVAFLINRFNYSRIRAVALSGALYFGIGILVILSITKGSDAYLTIGSKSLFSFFEYITDSILLPIAGLTMAIFVAFVIPKSDVIATLKEDMGRFIFAIWFFSIRFIAPAALIFMILNLTGIIEIKSTP